ncbi:MAG: RNA polymerase sigma factor (sigma-70 family) [Candidatus Azotimanducaceae bacterium]
MIESLESALSKLPAEQRDVYVMHEFEGSSFKEIAEVTGESVNTLLSRKRYAAKHLKIELNELYEVLKAI